MSLLHDIPLEYNAPEFVWSYNFRYNHSTAAEILDGIGGMNVWMCECSCRRNTYNWEHFYKDPEGRDSRSMNPRYNCSACVEGSHPSVPTT